MEEIVSIVLVIFVLICTIGCCLIGIICLSDNPSSFCYKPHTEVVETVDNTLQSEQPNTTKQITLTLINPDHMK